MSGASERWDPRRVMIGFDGSDGAKDAVALAKVICANTEASVLLVHVLPAGPLPVAPELLGEQDLPTWKDFFDEAKATLEGVEVEVRNYLGGSPAQVLNDIAENEEIDLVVIGSPHRGAIGRTIIGSVAEALLHGASVPVVAAPRGYAAEEHAGFARVLVGYDGSKEAGAALDRGAAIAAREGRPVDVVSVSTLASAAPGAFGGVVPPEVPDGEKVAARGVESLEGAEVEVRGTALHGVPAQQLSAYCAADDLLLLGSRGYGPVARTLLGSVSSELIRTAPCPVLVVPRPHD